MAPLIWWSKSSARIVARAIGARNSTNTKKAESRNTGSLINRARKLSSSGLGPMGSISRWNSKPTDVSRVSSFLASGFTLPGCGKSRCLAIPRFYSDGSTAIRRIRFARAVVSWFGVPASAGRRLRCSMRVSIVVRCDRLKAGLQTGHRLSISVQILIQPGGADALGDFAAGGDLAHRSDTEILVSHFVELFIAPVVEALQLPRPNSTDAIRGQQRQSDSR